MRDGGGALGVVGGLVGVARQQHTLAAALLGNAVALLQVLAPLDFQGFTLVLGERGADHASDGARGAQFALLTVYALGYGAV
jgi:hypothetical protein